MNDSKVISLGRKWHIEKMLGAGGFATVYLAQSDDGEPAVVKLIPKDPGAERELLFDDLSGTPNVLPILDQGEWATYWILVMPRADKSLRDHLRENIEYLTVEDTVRVLADVVEALVALENRVVHRDIKPDNILLHNGRWCLADFGISRYVEATTAPDTRKYAMTNAYAAPEQWRGERATNATDVYSLGVVAYEALAGQRPFIGPEQHDYRRQHLEDRPEPIANVPPTLQSLIDACLSKAPQARPRPQEMLRRLRESQRPSSAAGYRLQQANALAVRQRAEAARQDSIAKSESDRWRDLCSDAEQSFEHVLSLLNDRIVLNAPDSQSSIGQLSGTWLLNSAELSVASLMAVGKKSRQGSPIEVIAYSSITLSIPPDRYGFNGRAHSLWYCNARDAHTFRWYESAFMFNPWVRKISRLDPFSMEPGPDSFTALSPTIHTFQVAWPFTAIDQGDEDEFIERWLGWFADAAQGLLRRPRNIPERNPTGTWRSV